MTDFEEEVQNMTFEQSIASLESLVKELENGGIDLDKSIEIYEKAVILRNHCRKILDNSERRIEKIMETADGFKTEDMKID
ncbi:MAG: exodeoxyribonuclease VII small subunit [Thermoplasmata archaeon]|jgi:exodeoxyribonuclease VII small subunit|nr:exodeoxyribonuclease VII small subunit [Thermoplasmata archaeon]